MLELWHCPFEIALNPQLVNLLNRHYCFSVYKKGQTTEMPVWHPQLEQDCLLSRSLQNFLLVPGVQSKVPATGPLYKLLCPAWHCNKCFPVKVCCCNLPWGASAVWPALARASTDLCAMIQRKPTAHCLMASVGLNCMTKFWLPALLRNFCQSALHCK